MCEKLEGKLILNNDGYLNFESKSGINYLEIPNYFPLELYENNQWVGYHLLFDCKDRIYYIVSNNEHKKYKLKKDNRCRVKILTLCMLEEYRHDCKIRNMIDNARSLPNIYETYTQEYSRKTKLA